MLVGKLSARPLQRVLARPGAGRGSAPNREKVARGAGLGLGFGAAARPPLGLGERNGARWKALGKTFRTSHGSTRCGRRFGAGNRETVARGGGARVRAVGAQRSVLTGPSFVQG